MSTEKIVKTKRCISNSMGNDVKIAAFILLALILLLFFLPLSGCKKQPATVKKPAAEKVLPVEVKKDLKPEEIKKVELETYTYQSEGRRDPFVSLVEVTKQKPTKKKGVSPYESYDIEQLTLLAIAWDNEKHYALVMLPDKKSYTITEGMTLGLHGGKVMKITKDMVVIRELTKDYKGNIKSKEFVLKLRKEEEE